MIAIANFIGLPLLFFSSILIAASLIPDWMETLSLGNPVEWAVRASRAQALPGTDWGSIGLYLLLLAASRRSPAPSRPAASGPTSGRSSRCSSRSATAIRAT